MSVAKKNKNIFIFGQAKPGICTHIGIHSDGTYEQRCGMGNKLGQPNLQPNIFLFYLLFVIYYLLFAHLPNNS